MNNYCVNLTLPIQPVIVDDGLFIETKVKHTKIPHDKLNPELLSLFDKLNIGIALAETFYIPKFSSISIHEDGKECIDVLKINWVYRGKGSNMHWYEPTGEPIWKTTVIGAPYKSYDKDKVRLLHSQPIGCPSLLQVGPPHNVTTTIESRYCVSILVHDKTTLEYIPFNKGKELFKEFVTI